MFDPSAAAAALQMVARIEAVSVAVGLVIAAGLLVHALICIYRDFFKKSL
jgi:hypothetical protein